MALATIITLIIFLSHTFFYLKKDLSFLQNSILFMFIAILTRNYVTIMTMQLKWIKLTEENTLFLFYLGHREIVTPLLVLIFVNVYFHMGSKHKKVLLLLGILFVFIGMNYLSIFFNVTSLVKWNMIYAALIDVIFLMIGMGIAQTLRFLTRLEHKKHEGHI